MSLIASRSSWGARRRDGSRALSGLATEVFIHHSVTTTLSATATVAQERAQMRVLEDIGYNRFGTGISYNVIIFPSGRAYQGVSFNRQGAHTGGRNHIARAICFAGNFETNRPTNAAIAKAAQIVAHGRGRWWTSGAPVRPHQAVSATACPGRHVIARLGEIRSGTTPSPTPQEDIMDAAQSRKLDEVHASVRQGQSGRFHHGAMFAAVRDLQTMTRAIRASVEELAKRDIVDAIVSRIDGIDPAEVRAAVDEGMTDALARLTVTVEAQEEN